MRQDLQSIFIVAVAVVMTYLFLSFFGLKRKQTNFWLISWILLTSVAFLTHNFYLVLVTLILIKLFWLKNDLDKNMLFYLAMFPCLPSAQQVMLPVPGVHIMTGGYFDLLTIVVLLPLLPVLIRTSGSMDRRILLSLPILYVFGVEVFHRFSDTLNLTHTTAASILENSLTNKIRGAGVTLMRELLPFYAFAIWLTTYRRLHYSFLALLSTGMILLIITVAGAMLNWDIYTALERGGASLIRGGFLRISLTFSHAIEYGKFTYMLFVILFSALILCKYPKLISLFIASIVCIPSIYVTGSRSAVLGMLIILISLIYFLWKSHSRKITLAFVLTIGLFVSLPYLGSDQLDELDFSGIDSSATDGGAGTFDYRKRLLITGLELIPRNFWFGDQNIASTPEMEELRQGEGIIDTLNKWLMMSLHNGVPYMLMFLIIVLTAIKGCTSLVDKGHHLNKKRLVYSGAVMASILTAFSITAFFDSFSDYMWVVLGMGYGIGYMASSKARENERYNFAT